MLYFAPVKKVMTNYTSTRTLYIMPKSELFINFSIFQLLGH